MAIAAAVSQVVAEDHGREFGVGFGGHGCFYLATHPVLFCLVLFSWPAKGTLRVHLGPVKGFYYCT